MASAKDVVKEGEADAVPSIVSPTIKQVIDVAISLTKKDGDKVNELQITDCILQQFPNWCSKTEALKFVQEVSNWLFY